MNVSDVINQLERDGERADEQAKNAVRAARIKEKRWEKRIEELWDEVYRSEKP
jgi:hypothetical protein